MELIATLNLPLAEALVKIDVPSAIESSVRRKYFLLGLVGPILVLIIAVLVCAVLLVKSYDGKCGGYLPWLAGPKPCTLWEFLSGNLLLIGVVLWSTYWPIILALLLLPAAAGYCVRQKIHSSQVMLQSSG